METLPQDLWRFILPKTGCAHDVAAFSCVSKRAREAGTSVLTRERALVLASQLNWLVEAFIRMPWNSNFRTRVASMLDSIEREHPSGMFTRSLPPSKCHRDCRIVAEIGFVLGGTCSGTLQLWSTEVGQGPFKARFCKSFDTAEVEMWLINGVWRINIPRLAHLSEVAEFIQGLVDRMPMWARTTQVGYAPPAVRHGRLYMGNTQIQCETMREVIECVRLFDAVLT